MREDRLPRGTFAAASSFGLRLRLRMRRPEVEALGSAAGEASPAAADLVVATGREDWTVIVAPRGAWGTN